MGARSTFRDYLRGWVDRPDIADSVVDDWITFAEERINSELIHRDMISRVQVPFTDNCMNLPDDWIQFSYVKYVNDLSSSDPNVRTGRTFTRRSEHEFMDSSGQLSLAESMGGTPAYSNYYAYSRQPIFTVIGNVLFISPAPSATSPANIEIAYYAMVPALADVSDPNNPNIGDNGENWIYNKQRRLYTYAALSASAPRLQEDERVVVWEQLATAMLSSINEAAERAKFSGSPLRAKIRSF